MLGRAMNAGWARFLIGLMGMTVIATGCTPAGSAASSPTSSSAPERDGAESVGPLFATGLTGGHSCTASVVESAAGDVVLTAAHCVHGTGVGTIFAPGYDGGVAPFGTWSVQAVYVASGWLTQQDPDDDFAFLRVQPATGGSTANVQAVVGGHPLSVMAPAGTTATLRGYVSSADSVLTCSTPLSDTAEFPTSTCVGFGDGTSGSPWLRGAGKPTDPIIGVTGGKDQGGCSIDISYSAPLTSIAMQTLQRASAGTTPDDVPNAATPSC